MIDSIKSVTLAGLTLFCALTMSSCGGGGSSTSSAGITANSSGTAANSGTSTSPPATNNSASPDAVNPTLPQNPIVTAAPTCASLVTGTYELLDPIGASLAQSASRTAFDAAKLTTTTSASNGSQTTQWSADTTPCSFISSNGQSLVVSKSGLAVMRTMNGTPRALLMVPVQAFSVNEFVGKFNYVSFDKVEGGSAYSTISGFIDFSPAGTVVNNEICLYSALDTCNPTGGAPTSLRVNPAGGFDWTDSANSTFRAFGFKGVDGTLLLVAVRLNAGGITIATPPRALTVPAINSVALDKVLRVELNGAAGTWLERRYTAGAISSNAGVTSYSRQLQGGTSTETVAINFPAAGNLSIKPRGDSTPNDFGLIELNMPGLGLNVSIDTVSSALSFAIIQ
jgi:hypothetical protein